jgi:hypothetical protein
MTLRSLHASALLSGLVLSMYCPTLSLSQTKPSTDIASVLLSHTCYSTQKIPPIFTSTGLFRTMGLDIATGSTNSYSCSCLSNSFTDYSHKSSVTASTSNTSNIDLSSAIDVEPIAYESTSRLAEDTFHRLLPHSSLFAVQIHKDLLGTQQSPYSVSVGVRSGHAVFKTSFAIQNLVLIQSQITHTGSIFVKIPLDTYFFPSVVKSTSHTKPFVKSHLSYTLKQSDDSAKHTYSVGMVVRY